MYKVIVIDDEMLVRRGIVMETDWQALNCVVVAEAGNGIEGLEAVRKYHPDLLICDIRMPKIADTLTKAGKIVLQRLNINFSVYGTGHSNTLLS